jgi:hypothetical protein
LRKRTHVALVASLIPVGCCSYLPPPIAQDFGLLHSPSATAIDDISLGPGYTHNSTDDGVYELRYVQPGPQPSWRWYATVRESTCSSDVVIGTSNGYRVYTTDPFNKQSESREGDVSSLEMLFSTSLVALTLSPRVLRIQNTKVIRCAVWLCIVLTLCRGTRLFAR